MNASAQRLLIAISVLGFLGLSAALGVAHRNTQTAAEQGTGTLEEAMGDMARGGGYFFTLEQGYGADESLNLVRSLKVPRPAEGAPVLAEMDKLRQHVSNFSYSIDKGNPRIIHIIDSRLLDQKGYGPNAVIENLDFSGNVFDLVNKIGDQGIAVSSRGPVSTTDMLGRDFSTVVHIRVARMKVRDALSDFIDLKGRRGAILWIAETTIGEGQMTYIQFRGHPEKKQ